MTIKSLIAETPKAKRWAWRTACVVILLVSAFLRFWHLDLKPLHHDEGVNGYFLLRLIHEHTAVYDPANYHGPTLFYFGVITASYMRLLFGDSGINVIALRLVTAIFGVAIVWMVLSLDDTLGRFAALFAAALLSASPGAVFFSRYYIHETLFVYFTLAAVLAAIRFAQTNRSKYLIYMSVAAAFAVATKETVVLTIAVLGAALALMWALWWINIDRSSEERQLLTEAFHRRMKRPALWLLTITLFFALVTILYSSFFRNFPKGIYDALHSLQFWTATAKTVHVHPWYTYLKWLDQGDPAILFTGCIGCFVSLWRGSSVSRLFAFWSMGMLASYSTVPYKAPWLALNMLIPLAVAAGSGMAILWRRWTTRTPRVAMATAMISMLGATAVHAIRLNFTYYDDDSQPYVYSQTKRDLFALLRKVDTLVREQGGRDAVTISVASPEYWPLPWYLRPYRVAYPGRLQPTTDTLLIASHKQLRQLETSDGRYQNVGSYALRPGVELLLFVRK